jgi:hypothetical protein
VRLYHWETEARKLREVFRYQWMSAQSSLESWARFELSLQPMAVLV